MRVAINGFGRIGRLVLRRLAQMDDIEVVLINDLAGDDVLTYLFRYDSVHGKNEARYEDGHLFFAGRKIPMTSEKDPAVLAWGEKKVDLVIDATGVFLNRPMAQKHLDAGAGKVLLTAPGKEPDRTIVVGVNSEDLLPTDRIVSNASCTTNCLGPVAKTLVDSFGVVNLAFTTIHAYTSSQTVVDMPKSKVRRGRAAAINMIPTSTGASTAIAQVVPALKGKTAGAAMRVPTPNGSVTDITVRLENPPADIAGLHAALQKNAEGPMKGVLEFSTEELVSMDIVGNSHSSIFDSKCTMQVSEDTFKLLSWYDNEWGYSCRVVDLARLMLGL